MAQSRAWSVRLLAAIVAAAAGNAARAQTATVYDLRNNLPGVQGANLRVNAMEDTNSFGDSDVAINFTGDGRAVNWLEVYFVTQSGAGSPNGWTPGNMDFRLTGRYDGTSSYAADPYNPTGPSDWTLVFDTPSNADWLTPIYTSSGYNVYRGEFLFPVMNTTHGQEYTLTWSGFGNMAASGRTFLLFSNNSAGSFGASSDWRWLSGQSPTSLTAAGAPFPTVAARVGYVCGADFNLDGFVNGDDYDAFASLFESGDIGADVNRDGFVNGDDYDAFASAFEAGC
ncbi:MAG: GC-type dockerin domain-anchored protein [Phycisphaerales bacterium]